MLQWILNRRSNSSEPKAVTTLMFKNVEKPIQLGPRTICQKLKTYLWNNHELACFLLYCLSAVSCPCRTLCRAAVTSAVHHICVPVSATCAIFSKIHASRLPSSYDPRAVARSSLIVLLTPLSRRASHDSTAPVHMHLCRSFSSSPSLLRTATAASSESPSKTSWATESKSLGRWRTTWKKGHGGCSVGCLNLLRRRQVSNPRRRHATARFYRQARVITRS